MATIGDNIKHLRIENGMTQEQLAEELGTTESAISKYELNKRQPRYELVEQMAAVFRTSTGRILNKGGQLRYLVKQWKSRKDARLDMAIDSDLLETVQAFAKHDGLQLEDEVEKLLYEYTEMIIEEETSTDPHNE